MRYACPLGFVLIVGASASLWPALALAQVPAVGASAQVRDRVGRLLATATLREAPDQVLISLAFADRAALAGVHAIHLHAIGRCDPPDFASAGGIFNPFGKQHGLRNPDGPMAGDLPGLTIGQNGLAVYNTSAPLVRLSPGPASLLHQNGTSQVIFDQPDDGQTQPEGNAGPRLACGVIVPGDLTPNGPTSPTQTNQPASTGQADPPTALLIGLLGALSIAAGAALRHPARRPARA